MNVEAMIKALSEWSPDTEVIITIDENEHRVVEILPDPHSHDSVIIIAV